MLHYFLHNTHFFPSECYFKNMFLRKQMRPCGNPLWIQKQPQMWFKCGFLFNKTTIRGQDPVISVDRRQNLYSLGLWFGFTSNIVWDSKLWERGNCYNMRSLWLICISLFCLWLGLGFRIISEGRSGQGLHQTCSTDGQDFGERLNGTFTMIMAGSALLWVQTRRELSSDALNHHCLFRLQLTLLTGLSCPEKNRHFCNRSGIILVIIFLLL